MRHGGPEAVTDGTRTKRCDLCTKWSPLSSARVMGWCENTEPKPPIEPMLLIMAKCADDEITAYNQVCPAFDPTEVGKRMAEEEMVE